jgi:metal-dependent amidase/aminoacylase/carboxypeptidase family protein
VVVLPDEASEVVVNDPALAARLMASLRRSLGDASVVPIEPTTASEDFGVFGRVAGVPSIQLRVGSVEPGEFDKAKSEGRLAPGPHNSGFAPDRERTIRGGVAAYTLSVMDLLGGAK